MTLPDQTAMDIVEQVNPANELGLAAIALTAARGHLKVAQMPPAVVQTAGWLEQVVAAALEVMSSGV